MTTAQSGENVQSVESTPAYRISTEFYFWDVYLLVEGTLFRVPRTQLESSSKIFRDMFLCPTGDGGRIPEGLSAEKPIHLEGIRENDMVQLLRILYPRNFGEVATLSCEQWIAVLHLSTMWQFAKIRELAIDKLQSLADPTTKLLLYKDPKNELDPVQWLLPAVRIFAGRDDGLTVEEGHQLGMADTLQVCRVREIYAVQRIPQQKATNRGKKGASWQHNAYGLVRSVDDIIYEVFELQRPEIPGDGEQTYSDHW